MNGIKSKLVKRNCEFCYKGNYSNLGCNAKCVQSKFMTKQPCDLGKAKVIKSNRYKLKFIWESTS